MQDTSRPASDALDAGTPARRGRPPKVEGADSGRRQNLIAAAAQHFRSKGFEATTTRDIASATGMQSGSPFYHFKTKYDLLCAVMEEGMLAAQRKQSAALAALPEATSARDRLAVMVLSHLQVLWLPGNDFVPVMVYEWRSLTPAHRKPIQVLKDNYELVWRSTLSELEAQGLLGVNASLARSMLFGVMQGTLRWYKPKGAVRLTQLAHECVNAMVRMPDAVAPNKATTRPKAKAPKAKAASKLSPQDQSQDQPHDQPSLQAEPPKPTAKRLSNPPARKVRATKSKPPQAV